MPTCQQPSPWLNLPWINVCPVDIFVLCYQQIWLQSTVDNLSPTNLSTNLPVTSQPVTARPIQTWCYYLLLDNAGNLLLGWRSNHGQCHNTELTCSIGLSWSGKLHRVSTLLRFYFSTWFKIKHLKQETIVWQRQCKYLYIDLQCKLQSKFYILTH